MYHNNKVSTLKIHLSYSQIGQVLRLPGAVSQEVENTEDRVISILTFLLTYCSMAKMQPLVTDSHIF